MIPLTLAEVAESTDGRLDAFVMGVGTGGTVMGVGRAFRAAGSKAMVVAVEPDESAVISGDIPGHHGIQGLADGFIPQIVLDSGLRGDPANLAGAASSPAPSASSRAS